MWRISAAGVIAGALLAAGLPAATAGDADFGRLWRDDGVLRPTCHDYRYHYKVKPPTDDWMLETFLVDPRRHTIASDGRIAGADPKKGVGTFRFCRYNTTYGKFKVRGKLTYRDGYDQRVTWIKPGFFRLRKPS